jgi:hypothetical protein
VPFKGVLDRWSFQGTVLELRLSSGEFEPNGQDSDILYITVETPMHSETLERQLNDVEPHETQISVGEASSTEVTLQLDYDDPIILRGEKLVLRSSAFEAEDYARLARLHLEWGTSVNESLSVATARINEAKHLLEDQVRRISEKAKGHKPGSTAHTLYDQQLYFISRVLGKLDT